MHERLFRTAVPFYVAGRLDYPSALIDEVAALLRLDRASRVLDLGCGPGFLALAFASRVAEVVAMDPEPEMLAAARAAAAASGARLQLILGGSEDPGPHLGRFALVTMGRSFHWMDRPRTLATLEPLIVAGGGVALFRDDHPECPENGWRDGWRAVRNRYALRPGARNRNHDHEHAGVLSASAFSRLERLTYRFRRRTPVEMLISRALSMSSCSPESLGTLQPEFEAELRVALMPFAVDGVVDEVVDAEALVARRP